MIWYRGVLRGADGVLLDRSGNSLDRSLLLARLLEDAGFDTRLVRGRLSPVAVQEVLSQAATTDEAERPVEQLFPDSLIAAANRAPGEADALADLVGSLPAPDESTAGVRLLHDPGYLKTNG